MKDNLIHIAHGFELEQLVNALQPWLSVDEKRHALKYSSRARQRQYLVGRGLLRWLACKVTTVDVDNVSISRQQNGAPALRIAGLELACSISHKENAVMVACGDATALGIDIEQLQPRKRQTQLLENFSDGFMQGVAGNDLETFYRRWTLAEAVTKAHQGKLLATLRQPYREYLQSAVFHVETSHIFCCYVFNRHQSKENHYHWLRISVTEQQTLASEQLLLTNQH